jgi:four helix bundle protein
MASGIKTYRDLIVWQKAVDLVTEIYRVTDQFPKEEQFGLTSQMRRSSVSIPSKIAEGFGRRATRDYVRFLRTAVGSLFELQTQMIIAGKLQYSSNDDVTHIDRRTREIERMLSSLIRKLDT